MLAFDEELPTVLMEDDNENELAIVQPIVQDLLNDVIQQSSLKNLQELVDLTLEQVAEETHEKFFETLLAKCINDAVNIVEKSKEGKDKSCCIFGQCFKRTCCLLQVPHLKWYLIMRTPLLLP